MGNCQCVYKIIAFEVCCHNIYLPSIKENSPEQKPVNKQVINIRLNLRFWDDLSVLMLWQLVLFAIIIPLQAL